MRVSSSGLTQNEDSSTLPSRMKTEGLRFACPGREIDEGGLFVFVLNDT